MDLQSEQEKIYDVIGGFLRLDRWDDALWVSDFPRRNADTAGAEEQLLALGVCCEADEKSGLWRLDWTKEKWDEVIAALPLMAPTLPIDERLHPAYAFCRFALDHPAPRTQESLRMFRALLKGTKTIQKLHEEAAQALRSGYPIAYDAGRLLAAQLMKGETKR